MPLPALQAGDIVFTADGSGTPMHILITVAQRMGSPFMGGHANSVHAAIASGVGNKVYESVGGGLREKTLTPGNYRVFRYQGPFVNEISALAAEMAEGYVGNRQNDPNYGTYHKPKAALSPFRTTHQPRGEIQQFGQQAKAQTEFFCSNFVWRSYMAAAEAAGCDIPNPEEIPMPWSHSQLSPRDLEAMLTRSPHWLALNGGHSYTHP